jgi:hypothetical protein
MERKAREMRLSKTISTAPGRRAHCLDPLPKEEAKTVEIKPKAD